MQSESWSTFAGRKLWSGGVVASRDPEVDQILNVTRDLTSQAHRLATNINTTLEELQEFVEDLSTRRTIPLYPGPERRRDPR